MMQVVVEGSQWTSPFVLVAGLSALVAPTQTRAQITFGPPARYSADSHAIYVRSGDVNGDGAIDVLMCLSSPPSRTVATLINDGSGGFTRGSDTRFNWGDARDVALGDLDDDGDLDVIGIAEYSYYYTNRPAIEVRVNLGDGTFADGPITEIDFHWPSQTLVAGNLDRDAKLEFALGQGGKCSEVDRALVTIFETRNNGTFRIHSTADPGSLDFVSDLELGDVDGDGDIDIAMTTWEEAYPFDNYIVPHRRGWSTHGLSE